MGEIAEKIQEKIDELKEVVQELVDFGFLTPRLECAEHNKFLKCQGIRIVIEITKPNSPYGVVGYTMWRCDICGRVVVMENIFGYDPPRKEISVERAATPT
jgi:hypothetical protein